MIKLILTKPDNLRKVALGTFKAQKSSTINVLCGSSFDSILKTQSWVAKKKAIFIDTISESDDERVIFVPASNLTGVSIAINQAAQSFRGHVVVVFHSLASLILKNEVNSVGKFISFIIQRAAVWGVDVSFVFSEEGVSPVIANLLKQNADKIVKQ